MKTALFDPFSGISGNMVLGALLDAGLNQSSLRKMLESLPVGEWKMTADKVVRGSLFGTHVVIGFPPGQPHRHLADIEEIINGSGVPEHVKKRSLEAFHRLAKAEARAHGTGVEEVHFHEVGAIDAIIDIVGSFCGLYLLGVDRVFSSPVSIGTGTIECAHGILPVPSPATLIILEGVPLRPTDEQAELASPTGAAIITTLVEDWAAVPPPQRIIATGMGAGTREVRRPNLLRVAIGETTDSGGSTKADTCLLLSTLIDDLDPRLWPGLSEKLIAAGAVDCHAAQCIGKKGRPALELTVLCPPRNREAIAEILFTESTTLGIRVEHISRMVLERAFTKVKTRWGEVRVKLGRMGEHIVSAEPEYEDCADLANRAGVPVKIVLQEAGGKAADLLPG